jgi:hypothetical protein
LDAFKTVLAASVVLSLVFLGVIFVVAENVINNAAIPDIQYGVVTQKAPVTDNHPANYTVTLANSKILYVQGNQTLYNVLEVNKSYVFMCRIDMPNGMLIADSAYQTNRTAT